MDGQPTFTELILLRAIWRAKELSAREIHDATKTQTAWSYSSTRKTLDRMNAKGLVLVKNAHGINVYAAAQPRLTTLATLISVFARNVLDTDATLSAAAFAQSSLIDDDEIDDLQTLLDNLSKHERRRLKGSR